MPEYQLEVALVLAAVALGSLSLSFTARTEGRIRLPTVQVDEDANGTHDPFDVTKAEDFVDGYSIEGVAFWDKVCRLFTHFKSLIETMAVDEVEKTQYFASTFCYLGSGCHFFGLVSGKRRN